MALSIRTLIQKVQNSFNHIKGNISHYANNKHIVNYILYANCAFIAIFMTMIFFLNQQKISNYLNVREAIGRLKEISEGYELEFTYAQVTLKPNIHKINAIISRTKKERDNIINITKNIDNDTYIQSINDYITILNKRLLIHNEIINQYSTLTKTYADYLIVAQNAESSIDNNIALQLEIKHIMLDLEKVRLMSRATNRDKTLNRIHLLRNKLIYEAPLIQEKVGLFSDTTEDIVKSLRYLDTIRGSMNSDGYNVTMKHLQKLTMQEIRSEEFKFSTKLIFFLLLSIILVSGQFIILTLFFINKRRTEKLQKEALEKIHKSQEIADRAKQYALDAQRSQFRLLHNFCGDFDVIITSISDLSSLLKKDINSYLFEATDIPFVDTQKISISRLNASVVALEKWLDNYLEVYTPQDTWREAKGEVINLTDLFDKNFAEARFFMHNKQHLLGIFHGDFGYYDVISDSEYLLKLFMNMIYVSVKWSDNTWLKSSIVLRENPKQDNSDDEKKHVLTLSIANGASNEKYLEGLELFHKENILNQTNNSETTEDNNDRFMVASIYYMRQICDALSANIQFERNITDENVLNVQIPVALSSGKNKVISVPILKNKNILVVSPYSSVLKNISEQLKVFGLNVTGLSDKYSAIGHIVGQNNDEKAYDLFIIDHNLPDIDAESLTKIIRENYRKNLTHIIIITTENHLSQIEQNKSMYDAVFTKPVMPQLLKEKLEEFIEIQLYGQTDSEYSEDGLESGANTIPNESNTHRFLAIMDEELSTMLLQLVLTKVNYHVDVALTATQLYEFIENNHYQFIFISNKCPWIVPENLSRDIRRHHSDNKDSVLIMIYDTLKDATHKKLVRAGYDDFIPLPLSRSIFMEKIQDWHDPIAKRMRPDLDSPIQEVNNELDETSLEHSNNFDDDIDTSQNESNG